MENVLDGAELADFTEAFRRAAGAYADVIRLADAPADDLAKLVAFVLERVDAQKALGLALCDLAQIATGADMDKFRRSVVVPIEPAKAGALQMLGHDVCRPS